MNNRKVLWTRLSLVNLCITAFLGLTLRSKYLFSIPFVNYRNFISAHSHFAFGGWVTLALMTLYIFFLLPEDLGNKKIYRVLLWCIEISALGMALSFPFEGYAFFSITFSTIFIFSTYVFSVVFLRDLRKAALNRIVKLLAATAIVSLVVSSAGPFTLAYILATRSGDSILYRDAVYTYLHFQYNGFFTLSVFALLFNRALISADMAAERQIKQFSVLLCISVFPTLFLSLLWHPDAPLIEIMGITGAILVLVVVILFFRMRRRVRPKEIFSDPTARTLLLLSMIAFVIKMVLQMAIILPEVGNIVYGYRPIIIGFLHLIFLGLVSFFILALFKENRMLPSGKLSRNALFLFAAAVIFNEVVLLVQGIGLLLGSNAAIYPWLLWIAAILLFSASLSILYARLKMSRSAQPAD